MMTVEVDNKLLDSVLADPAAVSELPHVFDVLVELKAMIADEGCGVCRSQLARDLTQAYAMAKKTLTLLPVEELSAFKKAVGADQIAVRTLVDGKSTRVVL